MKPEELGSLIVSWLTWAVSLALLILISCAVLQFYGVRIPALPRVEVQPLVWLCGAWWLWRGGKV